MMRNDHLSDSDADNQLLIAEDKPFWQTDAAASLVNDELSTPPHRITLAPSKGAIANVFRRALCELSHIGT